MRRAARVDGNHREIVRALRAIPGLLVVDLSGAGEGVPDLCVGYQRRWVFLEIKDPSKPPSARQLTPAQVEWHAAAATRGLPCYVVHTLADALAVIVQPSQKGTEP